MVVFSAVELAMRVHFTSHSSYPAYIHYLIIFLLFNIQLFIRPIITLVLHCFYKIYN